MHRNYITACIIISVAIQAPVSCECERAQAIHNYATGIPADMSPISSALLHKGSIREMEFRKSTDILASSMQNTHFV